MNIMTCRKIHLALTMLGLKKTGIPLIEFHENKIIPFSAADDMGIYVLIPKLASFFGINIEAATLLFFYGIFAFAWITSFVGFFLYYKSLLQRFISFIGITLISIVALKIGDTYLLYVAPAIALVPWSLYFYKKPMKADFQLFYFCAGIIISLAHYIRTYSSLAPLFFISWLLIIHKGKIAKKIFPSIALFIGLSIPVFYFNSVHKTYMEYVKKEQIFDPAQGIKNHLLWHSIYAGLGFLSFKNPDNIRWGDPYALQRAQEIDPTAEYNTAKYENILMYEVFRLIKQHPAFMIMTLFAKIGILLLYLLIFANIGLVCALFNPQPWPIEIGFWGALASSSIFSLLVLPVPEYSLGFMTFAALYGITSINHFFKK